MNELKIMVALAHIFALTDLIIPFLVPGAQDLNENQSFFRTSNLLNYISSLTVGTFLHVLPSSHGKCMYAHFGYNPISVDEQRLWFKFHRCIDSYSHDFFPREMALKNALHHRLSWVKNGLPNDWILFFTVHQSREVKNQIVSKHFSTFFRLPCEVFASAFSKKYIFFYSSGGMLSHSVTTNNLICKVLG